MSYNRNLPDRIQLRAPRTPWYDRAWFKMSAELLVLTVALGCLIWLATHHG